MIYLIEAAIFAGVVIALLMLLHDGIKDIFEEVE